MRCATTPPWSRRSMLAELWWPLPPTCWHSPCYAPRASWAPTWRSALHSDSGCRWGSAARTRASWRCGAASSGACPDGWSASASTPPALRRCDLPCRPASSTSGARRPPATSAPRRCCSLWWRRCTRPITGRGASPPSRAASTGTRDRSRRESSRWAARCGVTRSSTPFPSRSRVVLPTW